MKPLILLALVCLAPAIANSQSTPPPSPQASPQATPRQKQIPHLDLFEGTLYSVEPLLDASLMLTQPKFEVILAAEKARGANPELKAAKAAEAAATGDAKAAATAEKKKIEAANRATFDAVLAANLTQDDREFIEALNKAAKSEKKRAAADAGLAGITKADPQYAEIKARTQELEVKYLGTLLAATLPEARKAAIEQARAAQTPYR